MAADFDPALLLGLEAGLGDDADESPATDEELRRIAGPEMRRTCAALKLASSVVGSACGDSASLSDASVVVELSNTLYRLRTVRKAVLQAVEIGPEQPEYRAAFNSVTNSVMGLIIEEWKWARLGKQFRQLPAEQIGKLVAMATLDGPLDVPGERDVDLDTLRRLGVLETIPRMWAVTNIFDYYQPNREALVARLTRSVAEQAEWAAGILKTPTSPSFAVRAITGRMYSVSAGLMCEVYKDLAARDVERLRATPELDRSVLIAQVSRTGMRYEHVLDRHRAVVARAMDTMAVILESQAQPVRSADRGADNTQDTSREQGYGA